MISSFKRLVQNLPKDKFKYFSQEFRGEQLQLVKQKGMHSYEYMNEFEKFDETNYLKKKTSIVCYDHVSNKDYEHTKNF